LFSGCTLIASENTLKRTAAKAASVDELAFKSLLKEKQSAGAAKRKGERTRDKLKIAAVTVLNKLGYQRMRISDICKAAGISSGSFYIYYANKDEITIDVLTEFLNTIEETYRSGPTPKSAYEAVYQANLTYIAAARANAGLFRCALQFLDEAPAFAAHEHRVTHMHIKRTAENILRHAGDSSPDPDAILLAAYTLGGMIDELCRRLLVYKDPHLQAVTDSCAPRDEEIAEFLSVLWYRALYAKDPEGPRFAPAKALAALSAARPKH
jgi:AcrR family transcriptional regulator